jgi:hypothetical protein
MRTIIKSFICIATVLFLSPLNAQDVGDLVRLRIQVPVKSVESIISGKDIGKTFEVIGGSTKFMVISKTDTEVKLQAPNYKGFSIAYQEKYKAANNGKERLDYSEFFNEKIYTIKKSDFDLSAVKVEEKKRISVGLLTLPFKARPQDKFAFDTEFNINTTMNIALRYFGDYSLNFQFGAGIGSVGLNNSNASGIMENQDQDVSTLTFLSGIMLSHKNLQIGLYAGIDHINNQANYNWDSDGNIWLAFGIGYDLFDVATANTVNEQN